MARKKMWDSSWIKYEHIHVSWGSGGEAGKGKACGPAGPRSPCSGIWAPLTHWGWALPGLLYVDTSA